MIGGLALIRGANGSMATAKSNGYRGQPCLVPLPRANGSGALSSSGIEALGSL